MGKRRRRRFVRPSRAETTAPPVRVRSASRYTPAEGAPPPVLTKTAETATIAPVQPKLTRGERRREQRKRKRRRRISAVGVVGIIGALIAAFVIFKVASNSGDKGSDANERSQTTLLFQIRGASGAAVASALLAHDPKPATDVSHGVVLLVPSRVIADVPGRGSGPFGNALANAPPSLSQATLSDLIGVTVDGGIVFDPATFIRFVNALGGIDADVDTNIVSNRVIVVPAGSDQHLDGAAALSYATFGSDQAQLVRVQHVLEGILAKVNLPADFERLLRSLGKGVQVNMGLPKAAELVAGVAKDDKANDIDIRSLDVKAVDTGGSNVTYIIDAPGVTSFVQASLADSIPEGLRTGNSRVRVMNGIGTPLLGTTTRSRLNRAGFVYLDGGNVPGFPFKRKASAVLIYDTSPASRDRGAKVAAALGLPARDVQLSTRGQSVADVIVVLGNDYRKP